MSQDAKENAALAESADQRDLPDDPMEGVLDEMLEGVPEAAQSRIRTMLSVTTIAQRTSPQAELMRKMTSENPHEFIQARDASDQRNYKDRQNNRWFLLGVLFLALVGLIVIIALLKSTPDLLEKIIPPIIALFAGAIGGYGVGYKKGSSEE